MFDTDAINDKESFGNTQHYYLSIIDCMPHIVYILDRNCMLTGGNKNLRNFLGLEQIEGLKGTFYSQLVNHQHFSEERIQLLKQYDINALLSGEAQYNTVEPPIVDPEGNIIHLSATRVPLLDENNAVMGLVVILTDISERKKLDEQLEKIKEQLQFYNKQPIQPSIQASIQRNPRTPPKILMIEDNIIAQKAAQAVLLQLDCHVDVADSGDKATALFSPGKYDLIFMDIGLEDESGYVVSKKIRQIENNTGYRVPIIALTGYEADIVKADCNDYFMEGAITKPLTREQAKQIIEHYIYKIDMPVHGLKSTIG